MSGNGFGPDDFDIELGWTEGRAREQTPSPPERRSGEVEAVSAVRRDSAEVIIGAGREGASRENLEAYPSDPRYPERSWALHGALASIAYRVDTLSTASGTLRALVTERLGSLGDVLNRVEQDSRREAENRRHLDASLEDLDDAFDKSSRALLRLDRLVNELTGRVEELSTTLTLHVDALGERLRQEVLSQAHRSNEGSDEARKELGQSVAELKDSMNVALEQIDQRLERLVKASETQKVAPVSLAAVQSAIETLSVTQAEELDRVRTALAKLDARGASSATAAGADLMLRRIQKDVGELLGRGSDESEPIAERLDAISEQLEGLKRRVALRGRSGPELDPATLDALADAVAARLRGEVEIGSAEDEPRRDRPDKADRTGKGAGSGDAAGEVTWGAQMRTRMGQAEYRRGLPGPRD